MNFKRIEWVFVIAFLGLNIFLFQYFREGMAEVSTVSDSNQTESVEKLLKSDDIKFSGRFSDKKREGYYLSGEQNDLEQVLNEQTDTSGNQQILYRNANVTDNILTYQMEERQLINGDKLGEGISAFLSKKEFVLLGDEYEYLSHLSTTSGDSPVVIAGQSFEGIPFNDDTAKIQIELSKTDDMYRIDQYSQTHISNIEKLREKMELYSEREAIASLYTNRRIPSNSEILWTQLAYSRIMQVREKNVYVPVWFVAIKTGENSQQIESVNALNNTVITNTTVPKVASE